MKKIEKKTKDAFFALLRAGLWEQGVRLLPYEPLDFDDLYKMADDQSVVGLIAAGLEHVEDRKVTKPEALAFLKKVFALEQRNEAMNEFIRMHVERMRDKGIYTLLIKGQGIAQCYSRPLWRASGDIDFFLNEDYYEKAKDYMMPFADCVEIEGEYSKHLGMTIDPWVVELHGSLRMGLPRNINRVLDEIMDSVFKGGNIRIWQNGDTTVFLPNADGDAFYVFAHFINHFYKGGIGLRQICDWCRLLWTFQDTLDLQVLESRLCRARLLSEWKAFGAFAVDYLGMPAEAIPLYDMSQRWKRKARRISSFILKVGNFGYNRDMSYYSKYPYLIRKTISFGRRTGDLCRHALIFPLDSLRFFPSFLYHGLRSAVRGE